MTTVDTILLANSDWSFEVAYAVSCQASGEGWSNPPAAFRWRCARLDPRWSRRDGGYGTRRAAEAAATRAILATVLASVEPAARRALRRESSERAEAAALEVALDCGASPHWQEGPFPDLPWDATPEEISRVAYARLLELQHPDDREHDLPPPPAVAA